LKNLNDVPSINLDNTLGLHKSDPVHRCSISLENESFLKRFKCSIMHPLKLFYMMYPFTKQLNSLREQANVKPIAMGNFPKISLHLVDTFFGFEVIIIIY
jgi:hypothetical protein